MTYPTILPKLTLDFANSRQLDPRITFSRSSSATYVHPDTGLITTAPDGVARFEKEGLLVEEARTNAFTYSEEFNNVAWSTNNVTSSANQITAPDGAVTADKVSADATASGSRFISEYTSIVSGTLYTQSVFAKAGEVTVLQIAPSTAFNTTYQNFNLSTGQLGDGNVESASITAYPNGWYRCTVTKTATSTQPGRMVFAFASSSTSPRLPSISLNLGEGLYLWGAQLEEGSFPTSYIPTAGSTATRAADVAQIREQYMNTLYNQTEGTFAFEFNAPNRPYAAAQLVFSARSLNSVANWSFYTGNSGSAAGAFDSSSGRACAFLQRSTAPSGKYAFAVKENDFALSQNGNTALTDNSGAMNSANDIEVLQFTSGSGSRLNGHISRLTYYDRRVSDAALQALTS